ncbi:FAD-binding domain-containing protein [Aspergillus saccharolyticus JOP 1030-1]|uniref:FAD-binding domain-containing protein n=1 Tax=Aspergillus saccharolyticus JOP 1030-1 TaxID=1450539 RepID=A0A318Z9X7_9EURO|nr:FAD-binding domain-containing protein [Aspergillus saccharolyticus JOP 1030-1]PYH44049.1 FAD-binding domain-containing protein [Aspergillus saccharolyticus JOP 1030-1]
MPRLSCRRALELKAELAETRAEVITPGDGDYTERVGCLDLGGIEAGALVHVTTTDEVSQVVRYAAKHHIPLFIHGGAFPTDRSALAEGGIVVSLTRMHKVLLDPASRTLAAQGGATWADIAHTAAASGFTSGKYPGSATSDTESAGGTGTGWLAGEHDSAVDNLLSVKLVLADGSIVTASSTEKTDLFWALQQAGQAFGVATEIVFRVFPERKPGEMHPSGNLGPGHIQAVEDSTEDLSRLRKLKRRYDPDGVFASLDLVSTETAR